MDYSDAGVNIKAADDFINNAKDVISSTKRKEVIGGIGDFAALFELPVDRYKKPVLVSATDGVGTKLKLAAKTNNYSTIGIDLVAMCVNDIAVTGAEPLFFLDYYATSKLEQSQATAIISSITKGCKQANISLIGGETAEMPNLYQGNEFDLAGFCVGCIEKDKIIHKNSINVGDVLIGINSSGIHANGFSLINHLIDKHKINLDKDYFNHTFAEELLKPTKIYSNLLQELYNNSLIMSAAHITGGGLIDNIPRILPDNVEAKINKKIWYMPEIFNEIKKLADMSTNELYKTFNCGIGLVLVVKQDLVSKVLSSAAMFQEKAFVIGEIIKGTEQRPSVCFI